MRTVFTLGVNADGSWTFDLDDQLDHVDASGDAGFNLITAADGSTSVPSIDFSSILVATDFDGDSVTGAASGSFTIAVENDVPIAAVAPPAVSATVVEDALLTTAPGDTGDLSDGNLDAWHVGDCVRPVLVSIQAGNVGGVLVAGGQLQPNRELLLLDHAGDRVRGA